MWSVYKPWTKVKIVGQISVAILIAHYLISLLLYKPVSIQESESENLERGSTHYKDQKSNRQAETLNKLGTQLNASQSEWIDLDAVSDNDVDCTPGTPCSYPDEVDFRIIVLTYSRVNSLMVLLDSVEQLMLDRDRASLEIWLDRSASQKVHRPTLEAAKAFKWSGGQTRVHVHKRHVGIYGQWIDTWSPRNISKLSMELAVILEDDMIISSLSYRWLKAVHSHYRYRPEFFGTTLESDEPRGPQTNKARLFSERNTTVFWYAFTGTWGTSPAPKYWHEFQTWYHQTQNIYPPFKPYIPGSIITTWYKDFERAGKAHEMWSIWLAYYMNKEKMFAIRNNLELYNGNKESCLSINRKEPGLHFNGKTAARSNCELLQVWSEEYIRFPEYTPKIDLNANPVN